MDKVPQIFFNFNKIIELLILDYEKEILAIFKQNLTNVSNFNLILTQEDKQKEIFLFNDLVSNRTRWNWK
jgi:hypothetical protein